MDTIPQIHKLSEYIAYVEDLPAEFSLSRGQPGLFELLPTALRKDNVGNRKYSKRAIRNFLDLFKINSYQYMANPWDIKNDIEWMLYAQHYGIPTKLMDVTTSHITSLLFAVENAFSSDESEYVYVYFINPFSLNLKHKQQSQIVNISTAEISAEGHDGPLVIQGRHLNPRVNAQKGLFILFQEEDSHLESYTDETILRTVKISHDDSKEILSSLYTMGISFNHVYPELSSIAKDILLKHRIDDYLREDV